MQRLIYISTSRVEPTREMVADILRTSYRNNRRDGLTGLLVVGGRRFLQVLEGSTQQLEAAYARIKDDPRHFALVELGRKAITDRGFAEWDMGCRLLSGDNFETFVKNVTRHVDDADVRAQIDSFVELQREAA